MAHDLDSTEGRYSFADSRTDAWHQLGQQIGHKMTADEALTAAHMKGWDVRKIPLTVNVAEGDDAAPDLMPLADRFAVVRTNPINGKVEPLGVVGNRFEPTQNEQTTDLLYDITDQSGAHIETIGALRGGAETFVTMLMPTHVEFKGSGGFTDTTEIYLAVLNRHDGQGKLRALISPVRIVCRNTQQLAESCAVSSVGIRHSGDTTSKLAEVRNLLGITFKYIDTYATEMEALVKAERDDEWVRAVLNDVFKVGEAEGDRMLGKRTENVSRVMEVYRRSPSIAPFAGTAYGAYNAVTEYVDHFMPVKGKGDTAAKRATRTLLSPEASGLKARSFTAIKGGLDKTAAQLLGV